MMNEAIINKMESLVKEQDLINIIKNYTSERVHSMDLSTHLKAWQENKAHIFKLFGNKLTIEREVEAALPPQVIANKLEKYLKEDFKDSKYDIIKIFLNGLSPEEIQTNVLEYDFSMFDTIFKKGMKISKCFKQMIKKEFLEEANIKYSMFLQSLKAKGMAVLSIDPKDFLTMSANSSGWRSCHAPDGEYRVGNVAYMMDPSSVISYIKSSDDVEIEGGTIHTNKIWRQIVLINPDDEFAIQCRQYPNTNDSNAHTIGLMLSEILKDNSKDKTEYEQIKADVETKAFRRLQKCHTDDYDQCYYNDIEHSAFDYGYLVKPVTKTMEDLYEEVSADITPIAIVGAAVPCLTGSGNILNDAGYYFYDNCNGYYDYE